MDPHIVELGSLASPIEHLLSLSVGERAGEHGIRRAARVSHPMGC
jgi:hypothetical protein